MASDREQAMLDNPETLARLREGIAQAKAGKVTRYEPGHFSKLAEGLEDDEEA